MNIEGMEKVEGKVCSRCGMWKPLEEYNKQKLGKYGRRADCKKCQKDGIIGDIRKKEAYLKPSVARKKKSEEARKRARKAR